MSVDDLNTADWARYGTPIDLDDDVNSRVVLLNAVGREPQRILELGPSAGLMTAVLRDWGHEVTGIEIDPDAAAIASAHAVEMVVGDLDARPDGSTAMDRLVGSDFDTLIAADVLEHVRRPVDTLRRALECVKHDGTVHLSIPNVAHGDVRLRLLGGDFDYVESGLMDRTHIQMFTLDSVLDLIRRAGLAPTSFHRAVLPLGCTEVPVDENLLEFGRRVLAGDPDAETYQWVISCQRADVVGDRAVWPDVEGRRSVVAEVLALMNAPVAQPIAPDSSEHGDVAEESLVEFARRGLGAVRRRITASLRNR